MSKLLLGFSTVAIAASLALTMTAGKPGSGPTFTLDPSGNTFPLSAAAADWSKNTGINVVVGACTGANCVHFTIVNFACGRGAPVGGCAYRLPDMSCQVEVSQWVANRDPAGWLDDLVVKHEAGHCLWSYLGVSQGFHLPDSPHALMSATQPGGPSKQDATLTNVDRRFTRDLVG